MKILLFLAAITETQKDFLLSFLLTCLAIDNFTFFYFLYVLISVYLYEILWLTTTRWSWGHKAKDLFCRLLEEDRRQTPFCPISREFDINPRVTLVGKSELAITLCSLSPNEWCSSTTIKKNFWRPCRGQEEATSCIQYSPVISAIKDFLTPLPGRLKRYLIVVPFLGNC